MAKYIDAEKLKAELIGFRNIAREKIDDEDNYFLGMAQGYDNAIDIIASLQQEQQEVELEKFTEKMDAWKARYNYPDNIPIKGTMAFTARMFYMYPEVAREWYDSLRKVTLD